MKRDIRSILIETTARLKALEALVMDRIPESQREEAWNLLEEKFDEIHQTYLQRIEDDDPETGAHLDDRSIPELED